MAKTILTSAQKRIIEILVSNSFFSKHFYLTGGTALSQYYLHHRYSEDLDFFSQIEPDKLWLNTLAKQIKSSINAQKLDIQESFNRNLVYFSLPRLTIKTEFTYFPFTPIEKAKIISNLSIDSLTDIAVNKFFTVYQKPTARHFIDLYLILTTKNYSWEKLERLARIKFDTVIDPIQLGSQLIRAENIADIPKMIINLPEKKWRGYFIKIAKDLKKILKK